jgi:flagellar hook-associated protein 1 FlgK
MGLNSSLQIGKSGLLANQQAVQVASNNLANMATPGYRKQRVEMVALADQQLQRGVFIGTGVQVRDVTRQVNEALESRLRGSLSDSAAARTHQDLLEQVEAIQNELSDVDLSSRLSSYFNAWSELAGNPQDPSLRTLVVEEAGSLAAFVQSMRSEYTQLRSQVDARLEGTVGEVDSLLTKIQNVNTAIVTAEGGAGEAHGLRDEQGLLLEQLSQYLDISTVVTPNGTADVYVGSLPLIINGQSRGVEFRQRSEDGIILTDVVIADDQSTLDFAGGELGALTDFRKNGLPGQIDTLDQFANQLIFQTNKLHTSGQGLTGRDRFTATNAVADTTVALTDPLTELKHTPDNGGFTVHLTNSATGIRTSTRIDVDLDGLGTDTSLDSLTADLAAVDTLHATIDAAGRLQLNTDPGYEISFSDDTSGALAALGVGGLFTGGDAFDIDVDADVRNNTNLLAAARDHLPGDNRTALAMSELRGDKVASLDGLSISEYWDRNVQRSATDLAQARQGADAQQVVAENLRAQQQAVSGVNADEETIDLLSYQRAYQASARVISTVDELLQTLMALV